MNYNKSFKSGAKVEVEFQEEDGVIVKLQTLVDQPIINNTFTLFTPMNKGGYYPARTGRSVKITFLHAESENATKAPYSFTAKIISRKLVNGISVLTLSKKAAPKKAQRRESFRLSYVEKLQYLYNGKVHPLLTKDLSSTGIKALVEMPIAVGSVITLLINLGSDPLELETEIVYSQKVEDSIIKTEIRGNFINLSDITRKKITKYLLGKQSEEVRGNLDSDGYSKLYKLINGDQINDRRHENDFTLRLVQYISLVSWIISLILVSSYLQARPRNSYGVERFFRIYMGSSWNVSILNIFLILSVIQLSLTGYGLSLNATRMKRENDKYSKSLIINLTIAIIGISTYFFIVTVLLG
ncbi:MAG: PilZ domain-containing protein [Acidaminobacteraceae bacterium]